MPSNFNPSHFTALVLTATEAAFRDLQQHIGSEQLYTFGLYTNGEGNYVLPTANTEEALTRKASVDAAADGLLVELRQQSLRWSPCDWGYHGFGGDTTFAAVDAYLETGWADDYTTFHYDAGTIYAYCLEALKQFRNTSLFCTSLRESPILLNLFMGDQSDEMRLEWATLLNSTDHCARLQHELAQGDIAFRQLADASLHTRQ